MLSRKGPPRKSTSPRRGVAERLQGHADRPTGSVRRERIALLPASTLLLLAITSAAEAQGPLTLELNRLEPRGADCRAYFRVENRSPEVYRSLKADLYVLDPQGVVSKRLAVEFAPLAAHKTIIKTFDVAGTACDRVGSLLLSGLRACEGPSGPREDCLAGIETTSKSTVPFTK